MFDSMYNLCMVDLQSDNMRIFCIQVCHVDAPLIFIVFACEGAEDCAETMGATRSLFFLEK